MDDKLKLVVNDALGQYAIQRARMSLLNPGGMGLDSKRTQAWCEYGFKENLEFSDLYKLYRRGGVAHGAVEKVVKNCWKTFPWVIQGEEHDESRKETPWERKVKATANVPFWRSVMEADRRRLVGRFSGLILRIRDSQDWDQPVRGRGRQLVSVIPAWASALKPIDFDMEPKSDRYGQPKYWQYTQVDANGGQSQVKIHYDRIIILGDDSSDAIGFLEPAFNAFVSLEKVEGGSGESFLKNAARQIAVNFDKEIDFASLASMYGVSVNELQEKFNEAAWEINRGNDQMLVMQGAQATPLTSAVADPEPTYDVNLRTISAATGIPSKILTGMQTGERASSEDVKEFNATCQSRRNGDLAFEIHGVFAHLMRIGVVDSVSEYTVMWDDLTDATQADKLANAKIMSDINNVSLSSGSEVFTRDEIRTAAGYEPLPGGDALGETDPVDEEDEEDDGDEDPPADPAE
ncbi:DUF1073 domain-containing protein [Bordetella sp. J329]|nr:DUF1073 domain-containing protein [Bordetella sp. J329]